MPKFSIDLSLSDLSSLSPSGSRLILDKLERQGQESGTLMLRIGKEVHKRPLAAGSAQKRRARAKVFFKDILRAHGYKAKDVARVLDISGGKTPAHTVSKTVAAENRSRMLLEKVRRSYPISIEDVKKVGGT